ncbi:ABC transporter substrate-binding protein [Bryobacterales bacterium F-183]|nr:ABC transporter substrate-binding protein [Bryobacterales bacterium F-183]
MCLVPALLAGQQRIVSTAPSFTETLFALGGGKRVVAVSTYCHFPPEADKLPRIGTYLTPNVEAIAQLRPDLVLVHAEQAQQNAQMQRLGLKTLALRNTTLADTMQSIALVGAAIGATAQAKALEQQIRGRFAAIEKTSQGKPRRTLLFIVGRTPGRLEGMIAVGKGSYLNELIRIAGGRNVMGDSPLAYPHLSMEGVMRLNPDVIVDMGDMSVTGDVTKAHIDAVRALWETQRGKVRAVREKRLYPVAADIFVVPGPRVAEAAEAFQRMLFP